MKTKNAFTLIEVMVVLSILAIIAILAYNFFGSTMKEAVRKQRVTKIYNDLRTISNAYAMYEIQNGPLRTNFIEGFADVLTAGLLKAVPPTAVPQNGATNLFYYQPEWNFVGPTVAADRIVAYAVDQANTDIGLETNEICKDFNEAYSGQGHIVGDGTQAPTGVPVFCQDLGQALYFWLVIRAY
jgi:prepilin-type N-terminal cleavage/methylation domain-containing protein